MGSDMTARMAGPDMEIPESLTPSKLAMTRKPSFYSWRTLRDIHLCL
jgi:hypothetical protein